jgi:flagellar hook assembly protein FlgD
MHRNPKSRKLAIAVGATVFVLMVTLAVPPAGAAPITVPAITTPTGGSTVAGDVSISATSTAPSVQFYVDAAPIGAPVAVVSGTATSDWLSWGRANGSHALTAADCDGTGCNASLSPTVSVTLNNAAPTVTSPVNGATTSTSLTLAATAPGGGLAFFVDTVQVGFDATSPYSVPVAGPLAEGAHSMSVFECDSAGTICNGPTATAGFTVKLLHPQITSVVPNPFSPNGDGRNDRLAFKVHLPDPESVSLSVQNGNGQPVWGPHTPGPTGAGDQVFHWDGRNNSNKIAGDGIYTIVVATTATQSGAALHGTAQAPVRLDNTGPAFSGITGNGATFYPVRDGYQDGFRPRVHVGEGGGLWLRITNGAGALVKLVAQPHANAGYFYVTWNGTNRANQLVPQGAYRFNFIGADAAGNRRSSAAGVVHVSHAHLVNKSVTLVQNGDAGSISTSDTNCTGYSYSLSAYAHGVWMDNVCDESYDGFQIIGADYTFTVPGAARYNSIRVGSVGNTINAPENILSAIYNYSAGQWDVVGGSRLGQDNVSLVSNFGTVAGAGRVSAGHHVTINIAVPDTEPPQDYDIANASITVSYSVLQ